MADIEREIRRTLKLAYPDNRTVSIIWPSAQVRKSITDGGLISLEGRCTIIVLYSQNQRLSGLFAGGLSLIWLPRPILAVVGWQVLTEPSKSFKSARGEIAGSTAHSGCQGNLSGKL